MWDIEKKISLKCNQIGTKIMVCTMYSENKEEIENNSSEDGELIFEYDF